MAFAADYLGRAEDDSTAEGGCAVTSSLNRRPETTHPSGRRATIALMNAPNPEPIQPADLPQLAAKVVAADRFPYLATMDGDQPRVRPVSPVRTDGFTVYVANLRQYHKTQEIEANAKVELCYLDQSHDQVRITGLAHVEQDRGLLQEIWNANPLLRKYLGNLDNPDLIVYRIEPVRVRFMREWALEYHDVPCDG